MSDFENSLRPGAVSQGGFLGEHERLDEVLRADDETVRRLGLTHGKIADRIEHFIAAVVHPSSRGKIVDDTYRVSGTSYRGMQLCPWRDGNAQYGSMDFTVENLKSGEKLTFPGLIVHLIRDHQFYEGKQSPYRVDPEHAARVLDIV